jgi:hypothetical protein
MPKYKVTLRMTTVQTVEAANPYMAAVVAREHNGDGAEIADVRPALGRAAMPSRRTTKKTKTVKKVAKKRRRMSPEARAKLAQNLVKARAARAAKAKKAKGRTTKKSTKRATSKRR